MIALFVALAGAGGVLARYWLSSIVHGAALPWMTVGINVLGSFLFGVLIVAHSTSPHLRTILGVGFLGGFTTFSAFTVQVFLDLEAGAAGRGLVLLLASVAAGLAAAAAGYYVGRAAF